MGWRDRLQKASFRNLPFVVEEHESTSGRRLVQHEFPGKDLGLTEDQGREPVEHSITAVVHGDDFDLAAIELERALQKSGWADLVLPHLGRRTVVVVRYRRQGSAREGRSARFFILCREVGFTDFPTPQADPSQLVDGAGSAARDAAKVEQADAIEVEGPSFIRDALAAGTKIVTGAMAGVRFVGGIQREIASFVSRVRFITSTLSELVTSPADLVASVIDALDQLRACGMAPIDNLAAYRGMFGLPPGLAGGSTSSARAADRNRQAIVDLGRLGAVTHAAGVAAEVEWESSDQALDARRAIFEEIDELAQRAGDDTFAALQDLRAQVLATVPGSNLSAPPALIIETSATLPAIVLGYRYLDDPEQGEAIAAANRVPNPLFVPGGSTVRIVRRGA